MKLITALMFLFFTLLVGESAFARGVDFEVQKQAEDYSLALASTEMAPVARAWHWDQIRIRAILEVGVEIPVISKLSINPEVEFAFVKK